MKSILLLIKINVYINVNLKHLLLSKAINQRKYDINFNYKE